MLVSIYEDYGDGLVDKAFMRNMRKSDGLIDEDEQKVDDPFADVL